MDYTFWKYLQKQMLARDMLVQILLIYLDWFITLHDLYSYSYIAVQDYRVSGELGTPDF